MSWRIVKISNRAKLDLRLNYLVVRADETVKIHLSEISILIIENTAVSLTAALLAELVKRKIKVVFCDEKRNPLFEAAPYYGSHDTSLKIRTQIKWDNNIKNYIWTEIVREKILQQMLLLQHLNKPECEILSNYIEQLEFNDASNREGHAAKVYFNALFGKSFSRSSESPINAALNYGYGIVLAAFNREIVSCGYITQLGIFHDNVFNMFNLGSDLMEPFRPLVDRQVSIMNFSEFGSKEKTEILNILNTEVFIEGKKQYANNAIRIYAKSVLDALDCNDVTLLRFYRNEL